MCYIGIYMDDKNQMKKPDYPRVESLDREFDSETDRQFGPSGVSLRTGFTTHYPDSDSQGFTEKAFSSKTGGFFLIVPDTQNPENLRTRNVAPKWMPDDGNTYQDDLYTPPYTQPNIKNYPAETFMPDGTATPKRRWKLPLVLFLLTCISVTLMGGWMYALALMTILVLHEAGHFFQSRRYGNYCSFPYFIPMPLTFIGTMGAVIAMDSRVRNRNIIFDIGITGPLVGLIPAILFYIIGLHMSAVVPVTPGDTIHLGDSLLTAFLTWSVLGPIPPEHDVLLHPMAFAGWFGMLLTAVNLFPMGQLDGGHVLYAMLGTRATLASKIIWWICVVLVVLLGAWQWSLMLIFILWLCPTHPPTRDDSIPLTWPRRVLGFLTLLFVIFAFSPTPFY